MISAVLLIVAAASSIYSALRFLFRPAVNYRGQHCLISGGSKGLGKALALQLSSKGAHVTILARNEADLKAAVEEVKMKRRDPDTQMVTYQVCNVTDSDTAEKAIKNASEQVGKVPKYVFNCAGAAMPGMFIDQDLREFKAGVDLNYLGAVHVIQPAVKLMVENGVKDGKIILVSSVLGLFGLVGYSQYSPTKFALRGLAETLKQELKPYGIGIHIMFPGTIWSPGFELEQKRKPKVTIEIEGNDGKSPEAIAECLISGIDYGNFFIASDPIGNLLRCVCSGTSPFNNKVVDIAMATVGNPIFSIWKIFVDFTVKKYHEKSK